MQLSVHIERWVHYLLQLICFVLRVNTGQNRCRNPTNCIFVLPRSYGKYYTTKQNEAKLPFRGHYPLHARWRFIGALVRESTLDHYGLGLIKPATFLRLRSPGHERACSRIHEASPVLRATIVYRDLLYTYTSGQSTKWWCHSSENGTLILMVNYKIIPAIMG